MVRKVGRATVGRRISWPAYTLADWQIKKLLTGKKNLGLWIGKRIFVIDYRGKMTLCQKNHAKHKMRKVV